ncbi:hypothetical protein HDU86_005445 [Geranomyces michiganensis]|nr:hypothetical protein HDU86_005445 [Geranomyces michiganensis]
MSVFSTAYVNFRTIDVMLDFCNTYKGLFVDSKGVESRAIIEFAPFQRIPKKKRKTDTRMNTIDEGLVPSSILADRASGNCLTPLGYLPDVDFLKFVKSLEEPEPVRPAEADASSEGLQKKLSGDQVASSGKASLSTSGSYASALTTVAPTNPKSTPLLDALRAQKAGIRAAAEAVKQAAALERKKATEAKALADDKRQPRKKAGKSAARKGSDKSLTVAPGSQQQFAVLKRDNSEASLFSLAGQSKIKSPEKKKKEITAKQRERPAATAANQLGSSEKIAPSGSLFNKSLGAVLGKREVKKARGTEAQSATDAASEDVTETIVPRVSMPATVPATNQQTTESVGRGYKSKRQALAASALAADTQNENAPSLRKAAPVPAAGARDSPKASRPGKGRGGGRSDAAGTGSSAGDVSLGGQHQPQKGSPKPSRQSSKEQGKGKDKKPNADTSSAPAKRPGISVSVINRDGTSSNYNTGENS